VSSLEPPPDDPVDDGALPPGHEGATEALQAAFARLRPQGSDTWNFLANFVQMGDRYGPLPSETSTLTSPREGTGAPGRLGGGRRRKVAAVEGPNEIREAMAQVVEAFRFLSARVRTLEERLARQDRPVDGVAWLVPARELGEWTPLIVAHLGAGVVSGEVLHADCGEGQLLRALSRAGLSARGVEPRGAVALRALELGCAVSITEVIDDLAAGSPGSLGGLVLSGVVDRLALHSLLLLLTEARRVLAPGAPIVVVATEPSQAGADRGVVAQDLLAPSPLHAETWQVLLDRAQYTGARLLQNGPRGDGRISIAATVPD
jgi:hypothetical protein